MNYTVIVSVDNEFNLITNFIENLIATTDFFQGELIIISDGCKNKDTLDYLETIKDRYTFIKFILSSEQKGYSISNNIAAKHSVGEFLVFINSDVLTNEGCIEKLVKYLKENPSVGAVQGCLIYPQNNRVQSTGHLFMGFHNSHVYKGKPHNHPLVLKEEIRQALTTALCAVHRTTFFEHSGFDESYFNAYEGMELTLKISQSGKTCVYLPSATAYHLTGGTRNKIQFDDEQAGRQFWSKWSARIKTDIATYLLYQITQKMRERAYFVVNCSNLPDWKLILNSLGFKLNGEVVIEDRFGTPVDLYSNLPFEALRFPGAYLFLCKDFNLLSVNHNWCAVRNNPNDIIIDGHGNIEYINEVNG